MEIFDRFLRFVLFIAPIALTSGFVNVTLSPPTLSVNESQFGNLTCEISGKTTYNGTFWFANETEVGSVGHFPSECSSNFSRSRYNVSCVGNRTFIVTLLDVTREDNGKEWYCAYRDDSNGIRTYFNSSKALIDVQVPLSEVSIRSQQDSSTSVELHENETVKINCTSSYARPHATILLCSALNVNQTTGLENECWMSINTTVTPDNNTFSWQTTSHFSISPNRTQNGYAVYCKGNNSAQNSVTSTHLFINVKYPPRSPPQIGNFSNMSVYFIIEQEIGHIHCSIGESNPTASLNWKCNNSELNYSVETRNNLSKTLTWISKRNQSSQCECTSTQELQGYASTVIFIDVLSPADDISMDLQAEVLHRNVTSNLSIIENATSCVSLLCSAAGKPEPNIYWWDGEEYIFSQILNLKLLKTSSGNYTCLVNNTMCPTEGQKLTTNLSKTYELNVLYPPEIRAASKYTLTEGSTLSTKCATINGRTTYQTMMWMNFSDSIGRFESILALWNVRRNQSGQYICKLDYVLQPTFGSATNASLNTTLYIDIQYPPEQITVSLIADSGSVTVNDREIFVIENTTLPFACNAVGNPSPEYSWTGIKNSTSSNLTILAKRNLTGSIVCRVFNKMTPNDTQVISTTINKAYSLKILYPPIVSKDIVIINATEGDDIRMTCITDIGSTTRLTECCFNGGVPLSCDRKLFIQNVKPEHSGAYNCTVSYTMTPTYGQNVSMQVSSEIELSVHSKSVSWQAGDNQINVGGVVGGALAAVAVGTTVTVIIVYILKKRRQTLQPPNDLQHHEYQNTCFENDKKQSKRLPALPPVSEETMESNAPIDTNHSDTNGGGIAINEQDGTTYLNSVELVEILKTIQIEELYMYVVKKSKEEFFEEYEKFPKGMNNTIPYTFARKPENAPLNRYQGVYPYDHSRVHISELPDFFINANYIDGFKRPRQYIASLGPTVRHTVGFTTFWNMVWYEQSDIIVMLTNLAELSGMKCEKYWAECGTSRIIGDFSIKCQREDVTAEYTVRTFTVSKGDELRPVTQLHFTAWPDKTVPESVTSLIEFRQRVEVAPTRSVGPIIIHCSAGIGRTGTYIALDRLVDEGKRKGSVNVFDCVMNMRKQRVNMVQTPDQYVYLHQALVYCLAFETKPVTAESINEETRITTNNAYSKLYQQLKQSVEDDSSEETDAKKRNAGFVDLNRRRADIPGDLHRVRLFLDKEMDESNYINAVYLDSFLRLEHFILAQSPLPKTVDDFICMLYQEKCSCVVSLDALEQKAAVIPSYIPKLNDQSTHGQFKVTCLNIDDRSSHLLRTLKITHNGKYENGERIVLHFEFLDWKHNENLPDEPKTFVEFAVEVEKYAAQMSEEKSHVVVHCMNGCERSGLFCSVSNLVEKMKMEGQVCVVNTLRQTRRRRRNAIPSMEQLKFCYQAVNAFVESHSLQK